MDKELCFIINGENLYLDISLIEFQDIPMFFICKSNSNYYVALCIDDENVEYILIEANANSLLKMLRSDIEMRDLYKVANKFWTIKPGNSPEDDEVTEHSIEHLDDSFLPIEGARYEVFDDSVLEYINLFEKNIYDDLNFNDVNIPKTLIPTSTYYDVSQLWIDSLVNGLKSYKNISSKESQLDISIIKDKDVLLSDFELKTELIKNELQIDKCNYNSKVNEFNPAA